MAIYTRTGDDGTTSLYGGKRVSKNDPQVEAYGTCDELTSFIGLVASKLKNNKDKKLLTSVQKDLYLIMALLAGDKKIKLELEEKIKSFENKIDEETKKLPTLTHFIIPDSTEISGWFHVLRTVCRRSERRVVVLKIENWKLEIVQYLNRLSDLFFTLARKYSKGKEQII